MRARWRPGLIAASWSLRDWAPGDSGEPWQCGGHLAVYCSASPGCRSVWACSGGGAGGADAWWVVRPGRLAGGSLGRPAPAGGNGRCGPRQGAGAASARRACSGPGRAPPTVPGRQQARRNALVTFTLPLDYPYFAGRVQVGSDVLRGQAVKVRVKPAGKFTPGCRVWQVLAAPSGAAGRPAPPSSEAEERRGPRPAVGGRR